MVVAFAARRTGRTATTPWPRPVASRSSSVIGPRPRCGASEIWATRFKLVPTCPDCGLLFEREEGFWLGAFVINFGVGEGTVGMLLMVFLFVAINHPGMGLAPWLVGGALLAVVLPIWFFPHSRTIWTAFDLGMRSKEDLT